MCYSGIFLNGFKDNVYESNLPHFTGQNKGIRRKHFRKYKAR